MDSRRRKLIVVVAATLLIAGCTGESLGPEYGEISEEESGLQFYAPGLAGGYRKIISGQDEQYINRMVAQYGPERGEFPHAQLILIEMPPRYYLPSMPPPQDTLDDWGLFENRTITQGPVGTAVNKIGRIKYAALRADKLSCVVFQQPFGTVYGSGGGGTHLIGGYYCKGEAPMMTEAEAEAIVKAVGHRKYGPIEPPAAWNAAAPSAAARRKLDLVVLWAEGNGTKRLTGTAYIGGKNQQTELRIFVGERGSCHGALAPDSGVDSAKEGAWKLWCGDGSKASGRYRTSGESAAGSGMDENANKVSLTIEP